jgi:class 3 adenylate cyclase
MKHAPRTKPLPTGYLAFMFTDIVGCTGMIDKIEADSTSDRTEIFLKDIKRPHDKIIKELVTALTGVIVKSTGDGFLVVFTDLEKAVLCAVAIQAAIKNQSIRTPDGRLEIRIGLNSGQALLNDDNDDYTCPAADKAKHVESSAQPGAVYLSSSIHNDVKEKVRGLSFLPAGRHTLKRLPKEELYSVVRTAPVQQSEENDLRGNVILIGDDNDARFKWFHDLFADLYKVEALQAKTLDEVKALAHTLPDRSIVRLVLLVDSLPLSESSQKADPRINFNQLDESLGAEFACLVTRLREPKLDGLKRRIQLIHAPTWPPAPGLIVDELRQLRRIQPIEISSLARDRDQIEALKKVTKWNQNDKDQRRQLRSLSHLCDIDDGCNQLLRVVSHSVDVESAERVEITTMRRSKSGAKVVRLIISHAGQTRELMFKLLETLADLEHEVREYHETQRAAETIPNYPAQIALLEPPVSPLNQAHPEHKFIVHTGQWFAIHYDLGINERPARLLDLRSVLTIDPASLQQKTKGTPYEFTARSQSKLNEYRLKVFTILLNQISAILYGNLSYFSREQKAKWKIAPPEDAGEHGSLPPYLIMPRVKGLIEDFLDSRDAVIGARMFREPADDWEGNVERVKTLVCHDSTEADLGRLGGSIAFTLSPVHCDLNADNVSLCLEHDRYPFVVDLPSYQRAGHCLQDFARLEAEIKLALLDRQEESPIADLAAYDYADSQLRLWIEMEERLLTKHELDETQLGKPRVKRVNWQTDGYRTNVDLCYRLIRLLRQKACEIQQKKVGDMSPVPFADEYLPALLYYSLQAISYPSLTIFKRLLAVYAAGSIFRILK